MLKSSASGFKIDQALLKHAALWIQGIFDGLQNFDEETQKRLLQQVGKNCAFASSAEICRRIAAEEPNTAKRIARLQEHTMFPSISPKSKDDWSTLNMEYSADREPCICPLVQYGIIEQNPLLCECTKGWIQANFEILLGQPVSVAIQQSVLRGAKNCRFTVQLA